MRKLLFSFCFILFFSPLMAQQSTYLKSLHQFDNSTRIRIIPASDKGWYLFSLDSLKIYKFSSCGNLQWAKKYSFPNLSWRGYDIIATQTGGFAFMVLQYPGPNYHAIIVNADGQGNVIWSKAFEDVLYTEVPYTLMQDDGGNFFLYGNVNQLSTLDVFNSLTKIDASGTIIWNKLYNHGGTWGGAIRTKDKGFLMRAGTFFIKTDADGNEMWTNYFQEGMYHYNKPVEVADGYIFTAYSHNSVGGDSITFFKLNKNGAVQWGGKKVVDFIGVPQELISKYNGNFIFMHPKFVAGKSYFTITELDKDLNIVNQNALKNNGFNISYYFKDVIFLSDSSALIGGLITINNPTVIPHLAFLKADSKQHFSCDTSLLSFHSTVRPVTQNTLSTTVTSRNFSSANQLILAESLLDSSALICSNLAPLQLNLGPDTALCEGSSITLKNKSSDEYHRFVWSTGETVVEITISQSGKYWLRAINSCRDDSLSDTLQVSFKSFPKPRLVSDTSICSVQPILLDATIKDATYQWNDGSTEAKYYAHEPGNYSVDISYLNCSKHFETHIGDCEILRMPNVITPNNDGVNNDFIPIEMRGIIETKLKVFNRWGQEIFETSDIINRPWTGRTYSKQCPDGVYYWIIYYTNYLHLNKVQKGSVTVFAN